MQLLWSASDRWLEVSAWRFDWRLAPPGRLASLTRIDRESAPSWKLADIVVTAGLRGILFPSLHHTGSTNAVIFPTNLVDGDHVAVHDPDHQLPQDQSSWR